MELEAQFKHAFEKVNTLKEKPSNEVLLRLYALYKQGTQGDIDMEPPSMFDFVAKAKFNAWEQLKGTTKDDAMKQYVYLVKHLFGEEK